MSKPFNINILTPDKKIYEGDLVSAIVPAQKGYLGILANHAPLMTTLTAGKVIFTDTSGRQTVIYSKGKGFLEVFKNNAVILLDSA